MVGTMAGGRTYWLDLFTGKTWDEFLKAGGRVTGFRERRWKTLQRMKAGDYLLCYLTGISRFVGVLEVTGEPFRTRRRSGPMITSLRESTSVRSSR
jgi:hypothetical protein